MPTPTWRWARRSVEDFFTRVSENALMKRQDAAQLRDLRSLRKELLEAALDYYQRLLARRSTDSSLSAHQAEAYERVGRITAEIGSKEAALDYYRKALALRIKLASTGRSDEELQRDLASTRRVVGGLLDELGHVKESLEQLDQAASDLRRLAEINPCGDTLDELARSINDKAIVLQRAGRLGDALVQFKRSREVLRELADRGAASTTTLTGLATADGNIGMSLHELGRADQALVALRRGREFIQRWPTRSRP